MNIPISPVSGGLNALLSAAVVNKHFCALLLTNATLALAAGYAGQAFDLTPEERQLVLTIQAGSLVEFSRQLITCRGGNGHHAASVARSNGKAAQRDRGDGQPLPMLEAAAALCQR
jgi:hypothetical protein